MSGSSSESRSGNDGLEWFVSWDVARLEIFVLFDSVLVKQDGASTKVGHKKLGREIYMLKKFHRFLQSNNVPQSRSVILDGTKDSTSRCRCASVPMTGHQWLCQR